MPCLRFFFFVEAHFVIILVNMLNIAGGLRRVFFSQKEEHKYDKIIILGASINKVGFLLQKCFWHEVWR